MAADPRARAAAASILAVCLLTVNSGFALYKARGDMLSTAFIALSYLDLALLLAWRLVRRRDQPQPSPPPGKAPAGQVLVVSVVCLAMLMLTLLLGSQLRLPVKVFTVVIFPGVVVMMFIIYSLGGEASKQPYLLCNHYQDATKQAYFLCNQLNRIFFGVF
uniref:Uncharacterized protein n=1 Tax=Oryza rufipogon TaxID=4529 RepID=A0A0E0NBQ5_ORYRU